MSESRLCQKRWIAPLSGVLLLITLAVPAHAGFDLQQTAAADRLIVRNLIGEISVLGHNGRDFEIEVSVQGGDASRDSVRIDFIEGSAATLNIVFPLDDSMSFVYPELGSGSTTFTLNDDPDSGWLSKVFGGWSNKRIKVSSRGSGLEIWADVTVRVPAGKSLEIQHGVGNMSVRDVDADLVLDSHAGSIDVAHVNGRLGIDVGSGAVTVESANGDEILVDTGSGSVELSDCASDKIGVDTGSGRVRIESVEGSHLLVDTGSGSVTAKRVSTDSASIDTGSGSVSLELDRMGSGRFEIDTGSGGIDLRLPRGASADISAETGSGGIDLDLDGDAVIRHKESNSVNVTVGDGSARVKLDTGSGSIRVRY